MKRKLKLVLLTAAVVAFALLMAKAGCHGNGHDLYGLFDGGDG
jgi:hypothetical protein